MITGPNRMRTKSGIARVAQQHEAGPRGLVARIAHRDVTECPTELRSVLKPAEAIILAIL